MTSTVRVKYSMLQNRCVANFSVVINTLQTYQRSSISLYSNKLFNLSGYNEANYKIHSNRDYCSSYINQTILGQVIVPYMMVHVP